VAAPNCLALCRSACTAERRLLEIFLNSFLVFALELGGGKERSRIRLEFLIVLLEVDNSIFHLDGVLGAQLLASPQQPFHAGLMACPEGRNHNKQPLARHDSILQL
jgi:hypothetical protein